MDTANAGGRKPYSLKSCLRRRRSSLQTARGGCGAYALPDRTDILLSHTEGDSEGVLRFFGEYLAKGIVVGRLSADALTQMKYFASAALLSRAGARYSRNGRNGRVQLQRRLHKARRRDEERGGDHGAAHGRGAELADKVAECKAVAELPPPVRKCVNYVNRNLHGRITLAALAESCGLSRAISARCSGGARGARCRSSSRSAGWKLPKRCWRADVRWERRRTRLDFPRRATSSRGLRRSSA